MYKSLRFLSKVLVTDSVSSSKTNGNRTGKLVSEDKRRELLYRGNRKVHLQIKLL